MSPAQAVLRWHLQLGSLPIPMSSNAQRQRQNIDLAGFALTDAADGALSGLEKGRIKGQDPDVYEEF